MDISSSSTASICSLNKEFLIDTIMSRLDGPTLAASASACSDLRSAAYDQNLWKNMCNATWPSIANLSKYLNISAFDKLYADAFPLILSQLEETHNPTVAQASSSDLCSFVDIYCKEKCILSKALDAIPEPTEFNDDNMYKNGHNNISDELRQWLLDCPFKLDLLPSYDDTDITPIEDFDENDESVTNLESLTSSTEKGKTGQDFRDELAEDIRLSWIMYDKKSGKAVNISSCKPVSVQKSWAPDGEYVLHFGSIVPAMDSKHKFAECKIVARCQLINNGSYAKWTEISLRVEDMAGAHLSTTKSLGVFSQALHSKRTTKHVKVEKANIEYKMYKKEMKRKHARREYLVDKLYALAGLTVLTTITYGCSALFQ